LPLEERIFSDLQYVQAADGVKGEILTDEEFSISDSNDDCDFEDSSGGISPVSKLSKSIILKINPLV